MKTDKSNMKFFFYLANSTYNFDIFWGFCKSSIFVPERSTDDNEEIADKIQP